MELSLRSLAMAIIVVASAIVAYSPMSAGSSLPYQVDDYVQPESQDLEFKECYPKTEATHRLSDLDYRRNGGKRYVTVIATYYTSCGPGRFESPQFSRYADQYAKSQAGRLKPKTAFLASLKAGVNSFTCSSWATLDSQNGRNLKFIDDDNRSLQYLFFTNEHPAYVVLDHCQRVRKYFKQGEMSAGLKPVMNRLLREAKDAPDNACPDLDLGGPTPAPTVPPSEVTGPTGCVEPFGTEPSVLTFSRKDLPQGILAPSGIPFLDNPRDLAFNPATRELYVINNNTQSIALFGGLQEAVVAAIRKEAPLSKQLSRVTAASRRDRGYYHYMARGASIAFDGRGHFATCQESENNYDFKDDPNFFMGPTLYDASDSLLFQADGEPCVHNDRIPGTASSNASLGTEPCFVAHVDMLHESPVCVGIAHDPETVTPWGNVYWAIGARYEPTSDEYTSRALTLLRYDFEVPHGIGVLDHSLANVRRYHDVEIKRRPGVPGHLVVDPDSNAIYIADTGNDRIIAVDRTTGSFDHHARVDQGGEFLLFSAAEPAFEYSVYQCLEQNATWASVQSPSGMALDANFVYVSEFDTGDIVAFEKGSGREAGRVKTGARGVMGLTLDPETGSLWFVNGKTNSIGTVRPSVACPEEDLPSGSPPAVAFSSVVCGPPSNSTLGEEIPHPDHDCGYQNQTDMCLGEQYGSSRDSCTGPNSFNLDMLLMTGFLDCHRCLPDPCVNGGSCENIWSRGYKCNCPAGYEGTHCQRSVQSGEACEADPNHLFQNKPGRDCKWVALKARIRCPKGGNSEACSATCDSCPAVCADDPLFLAQKKKPWTDCSWVGKNKARRCKGLKKRSCPVSCGTCEAAPGSCADDPEFVAAESKPLSNCDWVGKNSNKRSKGARLTACPVTCGTCPP